MNYSHPLYHVLWTLKYSVFWLDCHSTFVWKVIEAVNKKRTRITSQSNYRILKRSK